MSDELIQHHPSGLILSRGALMKVFDPAELKYAAAAFQPEASRADLTKYVGLVDDKHDSRVPVGYQVSIGACAGWGACDSTTTAYNEYLYRKGSSSRGDLLHAGAVYEAARKKRWPDNWRADGGSVPSDCFDLLLTDAPLRSSFEYVSRADFEYPRSVWDDGKTIDQLGSHRAIYASDPTCIEQMWIGLSEGMAIEIACSWPDEWMNISKGKLPENTIFGPNTPGHSTWAYAFAPGLGFLCANQWSQQWTPDAPQTHRYLRPGDYVFPFSYFKKNGPVFDIRLVTPEPVMVTPPQPDPPMPPKPEPSDLRGRIILAAEKARDSISSFDTGDNKKKWMKKGAGLVIDAVKGTL